MVRQSAKYLYWLASVSIDTEKICERPEDCRFPILGGVGKAALLPRSELDPSLKSQQPAMDRLKSMDTDNLSNTKEKNGTKGWLLSKIETAGPGESCMNFSAPP
jgi:hypothetical protein